MLRLWKKIIVVVGMVALLGSIGLFLSHGSGWRARRAYAQVPPTGPTGSPTGPGVANDEDYVTFPASPTAFYLTFTPTGPGTATQIEAAPQSVTLVTGLAINVTGGPENQAQTIDLTDHSTGIVEKQFTLTTDGNGNSHQVIPTNVVLVQPSTVQISVTTTPTPIPSNESITIATLSGLAPTQAQMALLDHTAVILKTDGHTLYGTITNVTNSAITLTQAPFTHYVATIPWEQIQIVTPTDTQYGG